MSKSSTKAKPAKAGDIVYGTVRSCDRCKEKKIRCNNAVPCNQCISHNATCTYNTPYRRKRYAVVQATAEQRAADAENKIKVLEEQLQDYKKKIFMLEKRLHCLPLVINIKSIQIFFRNFWSFLQPQS